MPILCTIKYPQLYITRGSYKFYLITKWTPVMSPLYGTTHISVPEDTSVSVFDVDRMTDGVINMHLTIMKGRTALLR